MRTCTFHEPPGHAADRLERAEALVVVPDGFSWPAALLTPFWLLAHRLWLPFVGYLVAVGLIEGVLWLAGAGESVAAWIVVGLHVLVGLEADSLRRWSLERRGYSYVGSVSGVTLDECERRFFDAWLPGQPFLSPGITRTDRAGYGSAGRLGSLAFLGRRG
jgi:hypothetical protein